MTSSTVQFPETSALLEIRHAVRAWNELFGAGPVVVALSGGADSLALTAGAVAEIGEVYALVVDHGLQAGSAAVAQKAVDAALILGCVSAQVLTVQVGTEGGPESAARSARYDALDLARGGRTVLIGHTLDDQAETVLLGLSRGSGPRSISGMEPCDPPWGRPLLSVRRSVTHQACADLGAAPWNIEPWEDPHNVASRFRRVRVRTEVLPLLESVLGGGVVSALARTAGQIREDSALLDRMAAELLVGFGNADLDVTLLTPIDPALRRRVIRLWLLSLGAQGLSEIQLRAVDDLVGNWHGQGGVALAGGASAGGTNGTRLVCSRRHGRLTLDC